jgi:hypothetical protein
MDIQDILKDGYKLKDIIPQGDSGYTFEFKKKGFRDLIINFNEGLKC